MCKATDTILEWDLYIYLFIGVKKQAKYMLVVFLCKKDALNPPTQKGIFKIGQESKLRKTR